MSTAFRVIDTAKEPLAFPPYKCSVTGRNGGEIVDFGVVQPGIDPRLYLIREVVEEAGRLVGMAARAEVDELRDRVNELENRYQALYEYAESIKQIEQAEELMAA